MSKTNIKKNCIIEMTRDEYGAIVDINQQPDSIKEKLSDYVNKYLLEPKTHKIVLSVSSIRKYDFFTDSYYYTNADYNIMGHLENNVIMFNKDNYK